MAPKTKSRLVDQPPSVSSSEEQEQVEESREEEEQQSGEEEGEEESGEETEEPKTAHPVVKRPITQKLQFSSESGSENRSGSESEAESGHSLPSPSALDFTVKPSVPAKGADPSKPAAKRQQDTQTEKGRKKPKIAEEEEKKSAATPRSLWSDDDQLALLKGIAEYKAVKGMEPSADMSVFHEFIRGKLQVEVSKRQLREKVRRLKKKYLTNVKDGEEPVFMKGQDFLVFEHSKRIWGAPGTSNGVSTNGTAKITVEVKKSSEPKRSAKVSKPKDDEKHKEEEKHVVVKEVVKEDIVKGDQQDFQSEYPHLTASFESMAGMSTMYPNGTSFLKEKMSLIANNKAKVLEKKWKKLEDDEAALMVNRLDLIAEHYRLVVDAMRACVDLLCSQSLFMPAYHTVLGLANTKSFSQLSSIPRRYLRKRRSHFCQKKKALRTRKKPFLPKKRAPVSSLAPSPIPATVQSPTPSPGPAAVPTLTPSPGPATVSPVYAPVPSIEVPTSSPPAVQPPSPVVKPPAKPPKLLTHTNSSKPLPVNPPDKPQNGPNSAGNNQEHRNYLIASVAGCSVAGIAFLALLIFCVNNKRKEIAPNEWETASEFKCRFNEEKMDSLFGYLPGDQGKNDRRKASSSFDQTSQYIEIIDLKKSRNLAILLKVLNATTEEVYDALEEGRFLDYLILEDRPSHIDPTFLAASLLLVSMGKQLLHKHKEEEKQVAVKGVVKEDIVKGDQQDFQSKYPRLAASMAGMSTMYPNGTSFLKENMSLIATDKAKVLEEKWKKLEDDEAALMVKRLDLIAEHYKLVVDAMRECNVVS
ncbi:hypothetical protein KY290_032810 [Solanum tuberosum]|uniref:Glabrous enhancer-binding protein-like DBD domain-containing protein n=1 Tax=Solanum tuberosum TaxID=4113 RepID=A0ABQ7UD73_SOLTU|nr:hypothetical protein KY289_032207 [Solanum tuberosum]KAH0744817.1 hypothetical protein KY290_032810 [Solanum tuberosum]